MAHIRSFDVDDPTERQAVERIDELRRHVHEVPGLAEKFTRLETALDDTAHKATDRLAALEQLVNDYAKGD